MAVFVEGNLWDREKEADVIVVTTNSFVKRNGEVAMGRGIALEAKNRYPQLPKLFGERIPHLGVYGLVIVKCQGKLFGAFQVKKFFKDKAEIELIKYSTNKLKDYALTHPDEQILMNFPGIGFGGLGNKKEEIKRILEVLPYNVYIFQFPRIKD